MSDSYAFALRSLRRDDIEPATDLLMLTSASGVRHHLALELAAAEAGKHGCAYVAEQDGVVIGSALLSSDPVFPDSIVALVAVAATARKAGVGGALADLLDERLAHETLPAFCKLRDDLPDGRRFAEKRGFALLGHNLGWSFDLAAHDGTLEATAQQAARSAGVRIRRTTLPAEIDTVLECALRCLPGLPSDQQADPEQAREYFPGNSIVLLAERDGQDTGAGPRTLGMTAVAPQDEGSGWYTQFTGVDPAYRRAGVARALKAESFLQARRAGARSVMTHNHETNDAILRLNSSFGMQPATGYWHLQRPAPKSPMTDDLGA